MSTNQKQQTKIVKKKLSELKPSPYNPRKWNDKEYRKLLASIREYGYTELISYNKRTGHIVAGHKRFVALQDLGYSEIDVIELDLDLRKEKLLCIAMNDIDFGFDDQKKELLISELEIDPDIKELVIEVLGLDVKDVTLDPKEFEGEIKFSPIIHRQHDYLIILFENNSDFINAIETFELKNIYDLGKNRRIGVGRVIKYEDFLKYVGKYSQL